MSENKDKYHDTILDLEEKLKKDVDMFLKIECSQSYCCIKGMVGIIELRLNVRDYEETRRGGFKSQQNLFQRDIKEMKDAFEQNDVYLDEIERQNDLLKDQLLEASLKHDIELCVLLNHECVDKSLHDELEQVKKKSLEIQEGLKVRIKILKKDVQRWQKQSVDFELKLQHEKEKHKWDSLKNKNSKPLDFSWISRIQKLEDENVSLDFKLIAHVSEKTYANGAIRAENQNLLVTISELKARMKNGEHGKSVNTKFDKTHGSQSFICVTPLNKNAFQKQMVVLKTKENHVKTSVLDVSKNEAKKEAVYVRKNKQTDNTFVNVVSNKDNVIDVAAANASKAKTLLCVSCMKSVLISCHDKCVAKHKLNVRSNARRTFSVNSRIPKSSETTFVAPKTRFSEKATQSKTLDTTSVASKSKIDEASASKARDKPNVEYFHVFGSLCYPTNDRDDLGKMKPKADIRVFIGYSETSRGFRIYNRRTKRIMETIHVKFDELTAIASEHDCLEPELQRFNNQNSSDDLMNTPSKEDLDNLFGPMFKDYFEQKSSDTTINSAAQLTHDQEDSPSTSSIIVDTHEAPPVVTTSVGPYKQDLNEPYTTYSPLNESKDTM
ncbi:retrovirus-related pol polyprotein from transposon TNT 1-94, partial [Tanacetum coccineum]